MFLSALMKSCESALWPERITIVILKSNGLPEGDARLFDEFVEYLVLVRSIGELAIQDEPTLTGTNLFIVLAGTLSIPCIRPIALPLSCGWSLPS